MQHEVFGGDRPGGLMLSQPSTTTHVSGTLQGQGCMAPPLTTYPYWHVLVLIRAYIHVILY